MITKRLILTKPFDIQNEFTKENILSRCNISEAEEVTLLVDAEKQNCEVSISTNKTKELIVTLFKSIDSEILGTNVYITSSLISEAIPKLAKVIYINPSMFVMAYYNDPDVESIVNELERLALFIVGNNMNNNNPESWRSLMKSYTESNIYYGSSEIELTNGEKYIYVTKKELFCDPNIFDDEK